MLSFSLMQKSSVSNLILVESLKVLTPFLQNYGITHRFSCPYTSKQNGLVERKHRHIVETGLSLLAHASMPFSYWEYAFSTAVYLINRLPTSGLTGEIPLQKLYNKIPNYTLLRTFGCLCFPCLRQYNAHKLDYRSTACTFLGYSDIHKGYKCITSSGRIYISINVKFDELTFPFASPSPALCSV